MELKKEVNALMELLVNTIVKETETLVKNKIRLQAIGNLNSLPKNCLEKLQHSINTTKDNNQMTLVLALSYSAKWEIIEATKKIAKDVRDNNLSVEEIDVHLFSSSLCTHNIPDPELLIRTSGEYRISNFLLWQSAYTEIYMTDTYWPNFREDQLIESINDFQNRERRFGKVSDQLKTP